MPHTRVRPMVVFGLLVFAAMALSPAPWASGVDVIHVPADFATIQDAVDAAQPGDIIQVAPGIYCENVTITTSGLRLHAPAGANPAVIDGTCLGGLGYGVHIMGAADVEIMGFVVQHFEWGFFLHSTSGATLHLNEVQFSATRPGLAPGARGHAIMLNASSFNTVSENDIHDNGHLGIGVQGASTGNIIRGNRIVDNNTETGLMGNCNVMVWNGASDNWIVENEVIGKSGTGIMLGPGAGATGNHVAQNRVHGFAGPGIIAMPIAANNVIEQNDARGNGLAYADPQNVDLFDASTPADNTWVRNLGTCQAGAAGC